MHVIRVERDVNFPLLASQGSSFVLTVVIDLGYMAGKVILYLCVQENHTLLLCYGCYGNVELMFYVFWYNS